MINPTTFAHLLARWNDADMYVPDSVERAGTTGTLVGTVERDTYCTQWILT